MGNPDLVLWLSEMDIPKKRRDITAPENVRWLLRNLEIRNGRHPMIRETIRALILLAKGNTGA